MPDPTDSGEHGVVSERLSGGTPKAVPDRIAIDANGFGWRVWNDAEHWSMVPTNPDNSPIPQPVTWFVNAATRPLAEIERRLQERLSMAREVLDREGHGDVAALVPIEEVLLWIEEVRYG